MPKPPSLGKLPPTHPGRASPKSATQRRGPSHFYQATPTESQPDLRLPDPRALQDSYDEDDAVRTVVEEIDLSATPSPTLERAMTTDAPPELSWSCDVDLWSRKWWILGYITFLMICNCGIPCAMFYSLRASTTLNLQALIGICSSTLGLSSSLDGPYRMWKLWKRRSWCGPLGDDVWYHFDCTMHVYSFCLMVFAIPLCFSSIFNPPLTRFFLLSTTFFVVPLGVCMVFSLFGFRLPRVWTSSDPPGTPMKPLCFYFFEDVGAVDLGGGRKFRRAVNKRWSISPPFRQMMWWITAFWAFGTVIYCAANTAVAIFTTGNGSRDSNNLNFAFAWVLAQLFIWTALWAGMTVLIAKWGLARERGWWQAKMGGGVGHGFNEYGRREKTTGA